MGRTSYKKVNHGIYNKCSLCGYEILNNKIALRLHAKYSHPEKERVEIKTNNRTVCGVCKKLNCREH